MPRHDAEQDVALSRGRFWWLVFLVLPLAILAAALGWMKISAAVLVGSVLLMLTGVLKPQEAYRAIDWSVIFLIAAFVPVGTAFVKTGTADFVASGPRTSFNVGRGRTPSACAASVWP